MGIKMSFIIVLISPGIVSCLKGFSIFMFILTGAVLGTTLEGVLGTTAPCAIDNKGTTKIINNMAPEIKCFKMFFGF